MNKRKDILTEINNGSSYDEILNSSGENKSYRGFIYETICIILMMTKNLIKNYDELYNSHICDAGKISITSFKVLLDELIRLGNDPSDYTYMYGGHLIATSIKYLEGYGEYDLNKLHTIMREKDTPYKLSLIVKDKSVCLNHRFNHEANPDKMLIEKINNEHLLLDEKDVIKAYKSFQLKLMSLKISHVDDIIEWMDEEYLNNHRQNLELWFHQFLAFNIIRLNIVNGHKTHLLSHKPRSGKTITLLYICRELLKTKKIILLMTSVMPDEILKSFTSEINKYNEFKDIEYKTQDEFMRIDPSFKGIILCSVQYLKVDNQSKIDKLKELNPDVNIFDECHFHSSNLNTYQKIINVTKNEKLIKIFASGTSNKTLGFYNVPDLCNVKWEREDEEKMKKIMDHGENISESIGFMNNRHSGDGYNDLFKEIYKDKDELNCDYSRCPLQVLLQPSIPLKIIEDINNRYDNKGYNCSSLFALKQIKKTKKRDAKYLKKFQLDENNQGRCFLKKFLESIISNDPNDENTMMRVIEECQSNYQMNPSSEDNPRLFLIFLPYGQNIGNIDMVQETLYVFIKENKLWTDYHVCYSSSKKNSSESKKDYSDFIKENMKITKDNKKLGCILFLGNQGKVGITYDECDVTISLDNGNDIDDIKQTYYRSMTERKGKTIGINVDFNIQRTLLYHHHVIKNYKKVTNTNGSLSQILQTLYKENMYIFNPHEMKMGDCNGTIIDYFDKLQDKIKTEIQIDSITDNIQCEDYLREHIKITDKDFIINKNLDGKQKECQKGMSKKTEIDAISGDNIDGDLNQENNEENNEEFNEEFNEIFSDNRTKHLYKKLADNGGLCLIIHRKNPNNDGLNAIGLLKLLKESPEEIQNIYELIRKECNFNEDENYLREEIIYDKYIEDMDTENNIDILNTLFEFFAYSKLEVIRKRIAETLVPSKDQIKENAEIPTREDCVDEMLDKIPEDFWKSGKKVFEPCCGKGNFVLGIFEKFYNSLTCIEDKKERCRIIIEECIYFSDIEKINIYHTKQMLMLLCAKIVLGEQEWDFQDYQDVSKIYDFNYNGFIGNTLDLKFDFEFDAIIGNPPYQERNKNGKSKHGKSNLWTKFINYSMDLLKNNGYLLFITPTSWMGGTVTCWDKMISNQIHYLDVNECKKYFPGVGSTFSYYLIEKCGIYKDTKVVCRYKKKLYRTRFRLNKDLKILPQLTNYTCLNILNKVFQWDNEGKFIRKDMIKGKTTCEKIKTDEHKYPVITFVRRDGTKDIQYSNLKIFNQDDKKVLLFRSGYINPTYENGEAAVGNNIHYAVADTEEEGYNLENLYKTDLYKFIFSICSTSQYNNGRVMNWLYRKNPQYEDIYNYFNLTKKEKELIIQNL